MNIKEIAEWVAIAGAVTWGSAQFGFNLVTTLLGANAVYGYYVVGAAGVLLVIDKLNIHKVR